MKSIYLLRFITISSFIIALASCKKDNHNIKTNGIPTLDKKIAEITFYLKTTLNVTADKVLYDTKKQEFDVYDLKFPLADIEKTYSEANEFKAKYNLP